MPIKYIIIIFYIPSDNVDHVPIGLLSNVGLKHNIEPGQLISFDDVEIPDSLALNAWFETIKNNVNPPERKSKVHYNYHSNYSSINSSNFNAK